MNGRRVFQRHEELPAHVRDNLGPAGADGTRLLVCASLALVKLSDGRRVLVSGEDLYSHAGASVREVAREIAYDADRTHRP